MWARTLLALWLIAGAAGLRAQGANPKEYQVKALFVFNFVQFVEWPASVFPSDDAPIRIGVLGEDPFGGALDAVIQGEKIRQRPLEIVRSDRMADLANCHVLFVARSERWQIASVIQAFNARPVLTVGDMPDFAARGGMLNFYLDGQKVRFEINRSAAQKSGLKMSSQLLGLARVVGPAAEAGAR